MCTNLRIGTYYAENGPNNVRQWFEAHRIVIFLGKIASTLELWHWSLALALSTPLGFLIIWFLDKYIGENLDYIKKMLSSAYRVSLNVFRADEQYNFLSSNFARK